jgi:hypothetical protein
VWYNGVNDVLNPWFKLLSLISSTGIVQSQDSAVGIATRYGLDGGGVRSSSPGRVKNFLHFFQTGSGVHPAFCPVGTGSNFSGGKAAGAWSWPLISN